MGTHHLKHEMPNVIQSPMSARTASSLFNYQQSLLSISVPPENFACFEENTAQFAVDTICG